MQHLGRTECWFRSPPDNPVQHLGSGSRLRVPRQTFAGVGHASLSQASQKIPIARELVEDALDPRRDVGLIGERHLVSDLFIDDVSRSAKVDDHGYGTAGERFEDRTRAVVLQARKHEHISRTETAEHLRMTEPAAKRDRVLDTKRSCQLFQTFLFRTVTDHGEPGQTGSQKWSSSAQPKVARLQRNESANEY